MLSLLEQGNVALDILLVHGLENRLEQLVVGEFSEESLVLCVRRAIDIVLGLVVPLNLLLEILVTGKRVSVILDGIVADNEEMD